MNNLLVGLMYVFENPYYSDLRTFIEKLLLIMVVKLICALLVYYLPIIYYNLITIFFRPPIKIHLNY